MRSDSLKAPVKSILNPKLVSVSADERLDTVDDIMALGQVRHLPVVKAGELVGIVSQRDLLRASLSSISNVGLGEKRAFLTSIKLHEIMTCDVITITPETSIQEAAEIMADEKIGCLPVVDDNHLMGMITETDLLHFMAELGRADRPHTNSPKKKGAA
ncbi:MAG: CBS domain-containing protein [Deltaproteobacteria bacterium]|nr:CBS domain-containing protein [Deltaproteobacteria bacterium]